MLGVGPPWMPHPRHLSWGCVTSSMLRVGPPWMLHPRHLRWSCVTYRMLIAGPLWMLCPKHLFCLICISDLFKVLSGGGEVSSLCLKRSDWEHGSGGSEGISVPVSGTLTCHWGLAGILIFLLRESDLATIPTRGLVVTPSRTGG